MNSEELVKQIETYSNAIIGFAVLQSLAYSYTFGTNAYFNCLVKTASHLAVGLTMMFIVVMLLSVVAIVLLGRTLYRIAGQFGNIVKWIYLGKLIVVVIFGLMPLVITISYGIIDYPSKRECKTEPQLLK
jgi:hypothetical protein